MRARSAGSKADMREEGVGAEGVEEDDEVGLGDGRCGRRQVIDGSLGTSM